MFWHPKLTTILFACIPTLITASVLQDNLFYWNIIIAIIFWGCIDAQAIE